MKPGRFIFFGVLLLMLLYGLVPNSAWHPGEDKRRAELHMVQEVGAGVSISLDAGRSLPTNWSTLSNVVNWELVAAICTRYHLPPATEAYAVLQRPVFYQDFSRTGAVFLVRAKPCRQPAGWGRWGLAGGTFLGDRFGSKERTNEVFRIWLPEASLSPQIRSQLTDPAGN